MKLVTRLVQLVVGTVLAIHPVRAAEFSILQTGDGWDQLTGALVCNMRMTGVVEDGDARKLKEVIGRLGGIGRTICLDSVGGSYTEAVSVAALLINTKIATKIEANRKCLSACSIIFMSGVMPTGAEEWARPTRELHARAQLGFHAPFIDSSSLPAGSFDGRSIVAAYQAALKGLRKLMQLNNENPWVLGDLIPTELILELLDREPNQLFLVDTVGAAVRFRIGVSGIRIAPRTTDAGLCNACLNLFDQSPTATLCTKPFVTRKGRTIAYSFGEEFGVCRLTSHDRNGKTGWHVEEGPAFSKHFDWKRRDWTDIPSWWMLPPKTRLQDIAGP